MHVRPLIAAAIAAVLAGACSGLATAQLHEGDIAIDDVAGVLEVGDVEDGAIVPENVFGIAFGSSGIPGFTADPGYNAAAGTFSPGSRIGFNFRTGLSVWDGEQFLALPGDDSTERLRITFFSASATSAAGFVPGFDLQVQPDGGFHRHLGMTLVPPAGEFTPTPGVYLMELELYSTDPALATSAPYWFVLDHESEDGELAAAIAFVRDEIAPPSGDACPADIDASGAVGFDDVLATLSTWGACDTDPCAADLDDSSTVDFSDLLLVLSAWGPCPG